MKSMRTLMVAAALIATAAEAAAQTRRDETGILPEGWSIDEEVKNLEVSVKDFNVVIRSLGSANTELQELLTKHLKNPSDRVNSSLLEKKIAVYASEAVKDFDRIISNQDGTVSNFRSVGRKLAKFDSYLGAKIEATTLNAKEVKKDVDTMEKQLEEMAASVKSAPAPKRSGRPSRSSPRSTTSTGSRSATPTATRRPARDIASSPPTWRSSIRSTGPSRTSSRPWWRTSRPSGGSSWTT